MNENRVLSLLGLAQKAGKIVSGETAVQNAVRSGKVKLIIVASDASENSRKMYSDMSKYYGISLHEGLLKEQMGVAIGKMHRTAIAVTDDGFGRMLTKALDEKITGE